MTLSPAPELSRGDAGDKATPLTSAAVLPADLAPHEAPSVVASALWIGTAAMLVLGIGPILLGGLAEAGRLSQAGVGQAATLEVLGLALGAVVGPSVMTAGQMRAKVAAACLLLAAVNLAMYFADSAALIMVDRAVAGVLEGLMLGGVNALLTHQRRPDRMSGLLLGLSTAPQVLAAYLLPTLVIPRYGLDAGFLLLAVAALSSAFACLALVDRVETPTIDHQTPIALPPATIGFVIATFLQMASIGAAWNYTERLATQHHLGAAAVGAALSGNLALQVAGALLAAWLAWRLPARALLIAGCLVQAAIVLGLTFAATAGSFIGLSCGFGLFWLGLQPFIVRELIVLDPTRRLAVLLAPIVLLGLSAGPLAASFFVTPHGVEGAFRVAAVLLILAACLFLASDRLRRT